MGEIAGKTMGASAVQPGGDLFQSIRKQTTTPPSVLSVLDAVTATFREQNHAPSPIAYFGALITMMGGSSSSSDIDDQLAEGCC
jgi:hypothetical protein